MKQRDRGGVTDRFRLGLVLCNGGPTIAQEKTAYRVVVIRRGCAGYVTAAADAHGAKVPHCGNSFTDGTIRRASLA